MPNPKPLTPPSALQKLYTLEKAKMLNQSVQAADYSHLDTLLVVAAVVLLLSSDFPSTYYACTFRFVFTFTFGS